VVAPSNPPSRCATRYLESGQQSLAASRFTGIEAEARVADWRALIAQRDELVTGMRRTKYTDTLLAYNLTQVN